MSEIIPLYFERADYCPRCNRNLIEAFDYFNNPMRLKDAATISFNGKKVSENYFKKPVYRLRCRGCGAAYQIKWFNGCPYPIYNKDGLQIQLFMQQYSQKD